jgi:hypothetical protein
MKQKLFAGLALAAFGLIAPVYGDATRTDAVSAQSAQVNPFLADVKAGQAKRIKYEIEAVTYLFFIPITGKAEFEAFFEDDRYKLDTQVKTTGIANIFVGYDLTVASSGYILDNGLKTQNYVSQNRDGKKNRRVEMTFGPTDVDLNVTPKWGSLGEPPAKPAQKLEAVDPATAMMHIAFTPRRADNLCSETVRTFDGKQLTHLSFRYLGQKKLKTKAFDGMATECELIVDRVAGYNKDDVGKNLTGIEGPMKIYFGEPVDGFVPVLRLVVDTADVGKITLTANKINISDVKSEEAYKSR